MYSEWLASQLSKNALALLFALLLQRSQTIRLSRRELWMRAALSRNTIDGALAELERKGLIRIQRQEYGPSSITLVHPTTVKGVEIDVILDEFTDEGKLATITGQAVQARIEPGKPSNGEVDKLRVAFAAAFPSEVSRYPLSDQSAKRILSAANGSLDVALQAIDKATEKSPNYPKAYVEKVARALALERGGGDEQPTNEMLSLVERVRKADVRTPTTEDILKRSKRVTG